jgi:hypothetical protein
LSNRTRRDFLKTVPLAAAALAASTGLGQTSIAAACTDQVGPHGQLCGMLEEARPPANFEPWWVKVFLPTLVWPTMYELDNPLGKAEFGQWFQVQAPQQGSRLRVFDPRNNRVVYVGAEAVGPVGAPEWAKYLNGLDGRWIDVTLTVPQHAVAMQADVPMRESLVTAGLDNATRPGQYEILRRVYNETMDSRTVPGLKDRYLLKNVLFTQYFTGDGAAIHYNWWGPPYGFGRPGSHGCLGMMYDDSKFYWDWADIGTPVIIHM